MPSRTWKEACEADFAKRCRRIIAEFRAGDCDEHAALNAILAEFDDLVGEDKQGE